MYSCLRKASIDALGVRLVGWSNGRLTLGFVWHVPWPEQPLGQYAMAVVARVAAIKSLEIMIITTFMIG